MGLEFLRRIEMGIEENKPLVHNITNYVTVNNCANIQLAMGGSPIMADDIDELEEIVGYASAVVLNIGTLNKRTINSMVRAGELANDRDIPVVLDPVGGGFTKLRVEAVKQIIDKVNLSVVKGNLSEIMSIYSSEFKSIGVDVDESHNSESIEGKITIAKSVAKSLKSIIVVTGEVDIVTDGERVTLIENGHASMAKITGTGCMLGAMLGVSCGGNMDKIYEASVYSTIMMGVSGEKANEYMVDNNLGNASMGRYIIDNINHIKSEELIERARLGDVK